MKVNLKKLALVGIVVVGLGGGAALGAGGLGRHQAANSARVSGGQGGFGGVTQQTGNPVIVGTVDKVGDGQFSLKPTDGSNPVTVKVGGETTYQKAGTGTIADLKKSDVIMVRGDAGSDGPSPERMTTASMLIALDGSGLAAFQQGGGFGFTVATVESVDGNTITASPLGAQGQVASKDAQIKIVTTDKTTIVKIVNGNPQDLKEGVFVMVSGPKGADGVVGATSVQIAPANVAQMMSR